MKNYFIIHGTKESPYGHWYPWLFSKLKNADENCIVPHFPDEGNYKQWKKVLEGYVDAGLIGQDTIFICHSLGCVFVTRFIVEHKLRVSGIIAVSGFNADGIGENSDFINEINKSFLAKNRVLLKAKNYVKFYHCIYSDNDPHLPIEVLMDFAKKTDAKVHEIEGAGHLTSQDGYAEFPFLWELLDKINTIV